MSRKSGSRRQPAWWHEPGPDRCDFCLQAYRVEAGYYCADCDRAVCPVCVVAVHERIGVWCPECASSSSGAEP